MSALHAAMLIFAAVFSTVVLPIPEEITLLGAGYWARSGKLHFWLALSAAYLAIIAGDTLTFYCARLLLPRLLKTHWARKLIPAKTESWAERLVARHGVRTIILARFLVGLRGPVYAALGASPYPGGKFMLINCAVGIVEVSALVLVGWLLGPSDRVMHGVRIAEIGVVAILVCSVLLPLALRYWLAHGHAHA